MTLPRRLLLLMAVTLMVGAMALASVSPAFAARSATGEENRAMPRETGTTPSNADHAIGETAPPTIPPGVGKRPESVEPKGRHPFTGPI